MHLMKITGETTMLKLDPNIARPDEFYEALMDLHRGLTDEQSAAANARLILLLANHVGDLDVLKQAIALANEDSSRAGA
jgi:hypothetical protein